MRGAAGHLERLEGVRLEQRGGPARRLPDGQIDLQIAQLRAAEEPEVGLPEVAALVADHAEPRERRERRGVDVLGDAEAGERDLLEARVHARRDRELGPRALVRVRQRNRAQVDVPSAWDGEHILRAAHRAEHHLAVQLLVVLQVANHLEFFQRVAQVNDAYEQCH